MSRRLNRLPRQIKAIWKHPMNRDRRSGAVLRWLRWQIGSRLVPGPVLIPFVNETCLVGRAGETGVTGNLFYGLAEMEEMALTLHLLRSDDLFVDAGANVGSFTVLAAGAVGASVIAFEPLPETVARLDANLRVNNLASRVTIRAAGLSDRPGELRFSDDADTMNHVVADGKKGTVCKVETLDDAVGDANPVLIKIDVEGHEREVLAGATKVLRNDELLAVIVETVTGTSDAIYPGVESTMQELGFHPVVYEPFRRELIPRQLEQGVFGNIIYVRELDQVRERLKSAPRFRTVAAEI